MTFFLGFGLACWAYTEINNSCRVCTSPYKDEDERLFDLRVLALGLGMEKRFVRKKDALEYYLVQALMPELRWLFCRLQEVNWERLPSNTTDFDLLQSRDDLR